MKRRRSLTGTSVAISAAVLMASACSRSGGGGGVSASTSANSTACSSSVQSLITKHRQAQHQDWYPTASLDGALVKGKNLWFIPVSTTIPSAAGFAKGFAAAGKAVGAKVTIFDGGGTPDNETKAIDQAVAAHADAIVLALITPTLVPSAIANANKANIPVVVTEVGLSDSLDKTVAAEMSQSDTDMGAWEADSALMATGCRAHALLVYTPGSRASEGVVKGVRAEMSRLCPACTITDAEVAVTDIATKTTGLVQNMIRRDASINVIIPVASPYVSFVRSALATVKSSIPIATSSNMGDYAGYGTNSTIYGVVTYAPPAVHGWFDMYTVLRLFSGQKQVQQTMPLGYVDASNRSPSDPSSYVNSPYANYRAAFDRLWRTSGS